MPLHLSALMRRHSLLALIVIFEPAAASPPWPGVPSSRRTESPLDGHHVAVGFSVGRMTGVGQGATRRGDLLTFQLGQSVNRRFHVVEEITLFRASVHSAAFEDNSSLSIGLRWTPFAQRPEEPRLSPFRYHDISAVYAEAMIGILEVSRVGCGEDCATHYSAVSVLSLGYLPLQGNDYALGVELRTEVARYDGGMRYAFDLVAAFQLKL